MRRKTLFTTALAIAAGLGLSGCVEDGYGYGLSTGYGGGYYGDYYGDFYDGSYGMPYYGWSDGYYYPGSGYYVYDRDRRPHRWTDRQRDYWEKRGKSWRGNNRGDEWRGFQRGPRQDGTDGYRWRNRDGQSTGRNRWGNGDGQPNRDRSDRPRRERRNR